MEAELRELFFAHVAAFASGASLSVVWPNVTPDPALFDAVGIVGDAASSAPYAYLRVAALPAAPLVRGLTSGWAVHRWEAQVDVVSREASGELYAAGVADALAAHIPATHRFTGVSRDYVVVSPASPRPPLVRDGWFAIPVSCRIQTTT